VREEGDNFPPFVTPVIYAVVFSPSPKFRGKTPKGGVGKTLEKTFFTECPSANREKTIPM